MKNNIMLIRQFRIFTAFCLTLAVFTVSSMVALAGTGDKSATGEITVSAATSNGETPFALINGEQATSGQTMFSNSTIATNENSSVNIKLGKLGFVSLTPNSNLNLTFGDNKISGNLTAGQVRVIGNDGVEVKIQTPEGIVGNQGAQAATFTVDMQSGATQATSENGSVFLNNGNTTVPVAPRQDSDSSSNSSLIPLLVFAGVVATAVIVVFANRNDNNTNNVASPIR